MSPDDLALSTYGARAFADYEDGIDRVVHDRLATRCGACAGDGYILPNGRCRCRASGPSDCNCLVDCAACEGTGKRVVDPDACRETVGCECPSCRAEMEGA